jgi:FlaA1/EpsC-like NDP-sugar epimerase
MRILVTGGAGSLGRAFLKTLHDKCVTVVDSNEWAVAEAQKLFPKVEFILGDFADVNLEPYDYVVHCAAYKHVDLGENNPESFIDNNIIKTIKLFKELSRLQTPFLFISTDKAVKPINLYGFTKAIGEKLALFYGGAVGRCGNLLSSSGSVIPVWEQAIANQQPIPITDERMVRYVIEDVDAANQLWYEFLNGEKVIIPKCKKMRLLDLLAEVLKKHGYTIDHTNPYEPGVTIIGLRPGEKLEEELEWQQ